jgi:ketosteroid isomerase-like protein
LKRSLLVVLAVLSSFTVAAGFRLPGGKAQQSSNAAEQEIRAIEALRIQYPLEPARWADRIDDNAVFTQGSGKVNTKAEMIRKPLQQVEWAYNGSLDMRDAQFEQFGDTAVLTYVYTRNRKEGEYTIRQHVRKTAVYQRHGSKWQIIASTAVALPNADREQKPVDPKILDSYAGLYEGDLRITRDRPRLMAQSPEDKEKIELLSVSNEAFAIRGEGDSILFVFEKGPDGRVQLRAHNVSGSESVTKRLD